MGKGGIFRLALAVVASGYAVRMMQSDLPSVIDTSQIPDLKLEPVQIEPFEVDTASTTIQSSQPKSIDPFAWNKTNIPEKCFYVEDICRTSHRWFYRPSEGKHQPRLTLLKNHQDVRWKVSAYRKEYQFEHHNDAINMTVHNRCVDSPVTNHVRRSPLASTSTRQ